MTVGLATLDRVASFERHSNAPGLVLTLLLADRPGFAALLPRSDRFEVDLGYGRRSPSESIQFGDLETGSRPNRAGAGRQASQNRQERGEAGLFHPRFT
jgi:hypothetical protein